MPLIETDLLKAYLDPEDRLHDAGVKAFELLTGRREFVLSSASLLELDLILKSRGFPEGDREMVFHTLAMRLLKATIVSLNPEALRNAIILQGKYRLPRFYFDSLHLGLAMCQDAKIVSSDEAFEGIKEVERIDPRHI